jgi:nucleotide-binding universal stress UspA family protein
MANMALNRIVCATDFSADATNALHRSVILAKEHQATLEVLHVVSRESLDALQEWVREPLDFGARLIQTVREELERCAVDAAREAGVAIETSVVVGDVTESIMSGCAAADLLVLGAHGTNPLKDAMIGTTAERIAGKLPNPMLIVRASPQRPYRNVLVAVDLLPGSQEVLDATLQFAGGALLTAIHAFDVPFEGMLQRSGVSQAVIDEHRSRAQREAVEQIAALSHSVAGDGSRFSPFVERGHPAVSIIERSRKDGTDLVVILKRARSRPEALVLGSVTRHVIADVETDVLLLAQPRR